MEVLLFLIEINSLRSEIKDLGALRFSHKLNNRFFSSTERATRSRSVVESNTDFAVEIYRDLRFVSRYINLLIGKSMQLSSNENF